MLFSARIQYILIAIVIALATHAAAYGAGFYRGVLSERKDWEVERARIVTEAAVNSGRLRAEGMRLAAALEEARAQVRVETVEKVRVVYQKASVTRKCFEADVTAILNRNTPIRERVERADRPAVEVVHTAATDVGGTSERAAAEWVLNAQSEYDMCRTQVVSLIEWIKALPRAKEK